MQATSDAPIQAIQMTQWKAGGYNVDKDKRTGMSLFTSILYFTTCTSQGRM